MRGICELCGRDGMLLTEHHLTPRARHNRRVRRDLTVEERNKKALLCRPCHGQLHKLYTVKQLERQFSTIASLKAQPDVQTWIAWIRNRPHAGKELHNWRQK
jgi:hypothetical protein